MKNFLPERVLRRNRALQDLMELCRAVIADGEVTETEARSFLRWIDANPDMHGISPVDQLVRTVRRIFGDGSVTAEGRRELFEYLVRMAGEEDGGGGGDADSGFYPGRGA